MTRPPPPAPGRADSGLTLLELVVVLALFALVAVMGLQSLTGTLHLRGLLAETERETATTTVALALLRADLGAAVPMLFEPPAGAPEAALDPGTSGDMLALSLGGQAALPGEAANGFVRAIWRFDAARGLLTRQLWPTLSPARADAVGPEVTMVTGISDFVTRIFSPDSGWVRGRDPAITGTSSALPAAVEITVTSRRFGPITLLQAFP